MRGVHHREARIYFAYGSNLNKRQMMDRCPTAVPLRTHELLGWRLLFQRTADITPSFGHTVLGALYTVTDADIQALDQFEGAPRGRYGEDIFEFVANVFSHTQ